MSVVAGVDLGGKRCRVCLVEPLWPTKPTFWSFEPVDKPDHVEAVRRAGEWARLHFHAPNGPVISVLWIEQPFGGNPRANFQLSLMAGALLGVIPPATSVEFVSAGECRKLVGLPARSSKDLVVAWTQAETDQAVDQHQADSFVVARAILEFGRRSDAA
jgi:hypothetical protein